MAHHDDQDRFAELDRRGREAAAGLREHVLTRLDGEPAPPADAPRRTAGRRPLAAAAAVLVLLLGSLALIGLDDGDRSQLDVDQALPDLEPAQLRPLGPRDGKDSIQLPVTVEPSTGLEDGDAVTATGTGFQPGERVGIVLCAREAGGETPEARGGVDGCNIGTVVYDDADEDGVATGEITVQRILTTPLTGTVDCAAEAERCMVAMGALSDYDRSGGTPIAFVDGLAPIELPEVTVTPTEGLSDGDVVHVRGDGLTPDSVLSVQVCSSDPMACWMTGDEVTVDPDEYGMASTIGLGVDGDGHLEGDVPVWRFLPGPEPGTYVDCAVSRCSLRLSGATAPPTVPLAFDAGGEPPSAPTISVEPTEGLAPGDAVLVRGAGFEPGTSFYLSMCAGLPGPERIPLACGSTDGGDHRIDDGGTFATEFEIPRLGDVAHEMPTTTACAGQCGDVVAPQMSEVRCDGVSTECSIVVEVIPYGGGYPAGPVAGPPAWSPAPVVVTFG